MEKSAPSWTVYGAEASGSIPIEAALTLLGLPYAVVDAVTWADDAARERVAPFNPLRQVPTVVLPGGEVFTESAAILIDLADRYPQARLGPPADHPSRRQFLRWMLFISSEIYSLYWILPDVRRIGVSPDAKPDVLKAVYARILSCWHNLDEQIAPAQFILGADLSVLDLYAAVVSRFGPGRRHVDAAAPKLAQVLRRVDALPALAGFWANRYPFEEGWQG
ncbi:MAG: glutathione S-transferase family protein [Burkholderiaceae bacterium]|jgi:GST-like protein